jgi:hypothetical protein
MKKLIVVGLIVTGGLLAFSFTNNTKVNVDSENVDCNYGQCSATSKSTGERCRNCAQQGSYYCWSHNHQ